VNAVRQSLTPLEDFDEEYRTDPEEETTNRTLIKNAPRKPAGHSLVPGKYVMPNDEET